MFLTGAANALLITQMVVLLPGTSAERRPRFLGGILTNLCVLVVLFCLGGAVFQSASSWFAPTAASTIIAFSVGVLASGLTLRDFVVRYAYSVGKSVVAFVLMLFIFVLVVGLIFGALQSGAGATLLSKLWAMACTISAALIWVLFCRTQFSRITVEEAFATFRETWRGGGFAFLSHIIVFFRSQAYIFLIALLFTIDNVAEVNAVRIFVAPLLVFIRAVTQIITPRVTENLLTNPGIASKIVLIWTIAITICVCIYLVLALFIYMISGDFLSNRGYDLDLGLFTAWACIVILVALRSMQEVLIVSSQRFSLQALSNLAGSAVLLVAVFALSFLKNEISVLAALALSELFVMAHMFFANRKYILMRMDGLKP